MLPPVPVLAASGGLVRQKSAAMRYSAPSDPSPSKLQADLAHKAFEAHGLFRKVPHVGFLYSNLPEDLDEQMIVDRSH